MEAKNIYEEKRPWGSFRRFTKDISSTVKIITVTSGEMFSLQSHAKRDEFWRIIRGSGVVVIGEDATPVKAGDERFIPRGVKHRASAGKDGLEILEIATGEFDEEDIIRFEDKYGRN